MNKNLRNEQEKLTLVVSLRIHLAVADPGTDKIGPHLFVDDLSIHAWCIRLVQMFFDDFFSEVGEVSYLMVLV